MTEVVVYRPKPPVSESGFSMGDGMESLSGVYLVRQDANLVAVYNPTYFLSAQEVVGDFIELIRADPDWRDFDDDYAIWFNQSPGWRIVAVIQWRAIEENQRVTVFEEARFLPRPWPYWPTREEWIESGRGDLWKTDRYP
jgi:hypothetical protein